MQNWQTFLPNRLSRLYQSRMSHSTTVGDVRRHYESLAASFGAPPADLIVERAQLGLPGKTFQGHAYFTAPNPPFGAVFTYYLKDELKSRRKQRQVGNCGREALRLVRSSVACWAAAALRSC